MPPGITVGAAHVQVLPSLRGFQRDIGRQLRGVKTDVTAKVRPELDTAAVAKAEADIRALSRRLSGARDVEAAAAGKVRVAEQRLKELRESGKAKASQLAAAEENLAQTHRRLAQAQSTVATTTGELDGAHRRLAAAQHRLAASTQTAERSNRGFLGSLRDIGARIRGVDDAPLRRVGGSLLRVGAYGTVAATGLTAMAATAPGLAALVGVLTQLAGVAGLIPAAIGAGGLALGTLALGVVGLKDRFKPPAGSAGRSTAAAQRAITDAQVAGARRVEAAERSLARAQQAEQEAQEALTRARREAAEQLEDLRLAVSGAALDERAAVIGLARAKEQLDAAQKAGATGLDLQEVVLGVDQAQQALDEARERYADLRVEAAAAEKTGVNGADNVVRAQRQVVDATQDVADAQREVGQAHQEAARGVADAQEALAQSQQRLAAAAPPAIAAAAAAFVDSVKQLGPAWTSLRLDVQQRLLDGISDRVTALGGRYLPILRGALDTVADGFNRSATQTAKFFETPAAASDIATALGSMAASLSTASLAATPLASAWTDIMSVGASFLPGLSSEFVTLATGFADFIREARESGQLREWIQGGLDILKALGAAGADVFGILRGLFSAASVDGQGALGLLGQLLDRTNKWVNSVQGQNALSTFFESTTRVVSALAPVLEKTAGIFGTVVAPAIADFVEELTPGLDAVVDAVAQGLRELVASGALISIARAITEVTKAVTPLIPPLAELGAELLVQLAEIVVELAPELGPLVDALVDLIIAAIPLTPALTDLVHLMLQIALLVLPPLVEQLNIVAAVVAWVSEKFEIGRQRVGSMSDAFGAFGVFLKSVWDKYLWPVLGGGLVELVDSLPGHFHDAVDAIGRAWSRLKEVAAAPVNFLITTIYGKGIKAIWDKVAGLVGLPTLPDISPITFGSDAPGASRGLAAFDAGGVLGGYAPGRDIVPALLSPGEAVLVPELVRALGADRILAANYAASGRRPVRDGRFAGGGIVGRAVDAVRGGAAWATGLFADPIGALRSMFGDPAARVRSELGVTPYVDLLAALPGRLVDEAVDYLAGAVRRVFTSSAGAGAGVSRWSDVAAQALGLLGQPAGLLPNVLSRMRRESGGNPTVVNTWDVNWQRGTPSVGLMQVIGPTFRAYAGPFGGKGPFLYGVSTDPLANTYAGLNYALHRYPSLQYAMDKPGGYDAGGYLPPGWSTVWNGTGRPEPVLTDAQWNSLARGGLPRELDGARITGTLDLGDGLSGYVDGRIELANQRTGTAINQRRRV